ncbi:MAG: DegT/DnrJ/EryC1/StrS aminotransferase family protein [Candidatus Brocadiaceae bacterium]|nr:DegT/DnrJ/EryC1/StrS aminotransferase family protein [Candidatus Brocadiaceae bacterium]
MGLNWPLMENNITRQDFDVLIDFLKGEPVLTQSSNVRAFEQEWSDWLGIGKSVFVNSGSSANHITLAALKALKGTGEVIVSPFGWVSDIAALLQNGFTPVFVDIDPHTMSMNNRQILEKLNDRTRAVLMIHIQGFDGFTDDNLFKELDDRHIPLIEDVCESHGVTHKGNKVGTFGLASNFSFYYAHHMSTIEGGMVSTNDQEFYQIIRMIRSHGMVREVTDNSIKDRYIRENPELNPEFIFAFPACNFRNTEIGAVVGRNQLKRLDRNIAKRTQNLKLFLDNIDANRYRTGFKLEGSSNYAFNLILQEADDILCEKVMKVLQENTVEFRRGSAGGGNQLRQPYLKGLVSPDAYKNFPEVEHIHFYGFYIGNYPTLKEEKILRLCTLLNGL